MKSFLQFAAEGFVNFGDYNLETKFHHYNQICFDNSIPACPVIWADKITLGGKHAAGITEFEFGKYSKQMTPGSLVIKISTYFKRTTEGLDSTLIHEMIHAYLASHGAPDAKHGWQFRAKAWECEKKVGIKINLTDNLFELELANPSDVEATVVLRKDSRHWYCHFYNGTAYDSPEKQAELKSYYGFPGRLHPDEEIFVIKVQTSLIGKYGFARGGTIQRTIQGIANAEANDILQRGKILFKILPNSVSHDDAQAHLPTKDALVVLTIDKQNPLRSRASFYSASMAADPMKVYELKQRWGRYKSDNHSIEIFVAHSTIFSVRGFKLQRDIKSSAAFLVKPNEVEDLRRNSTFLASL